MNILDYRDKNILNLSSMELEKIVPRADFDMEKGIEVVRPMLRDVKEKGAEVLYEYARKFDGVEQDPELGGMGIKVETEILKEAWENLDSDLKEALKEAEKRIRLVHHEQLPKDYETTVVSGGSVTQRYIPVARVGLYVPGGQAVYPSSVLMNVIPAQEAGVKSLVVASPAQKEYDGLPHPTILAACYMLGVDEVVAIGGAGAIAALAYGVENVVNPVSVITGPGNIYVAAAKQLVQGTVGIDAIAGPTEIGIIADEFANPKFVAADLIGQAEHDKLAGSVLFTDSEKFADDVNQAVSMQLLGTKHKDRAGVALDGKQSAIILVNNIKECVALANAYGAEHLEIQTKNYQEVAKKIISAGAIFMGPYSPVPLGDYIGGSNHVLPTGGSSKFSSGLSVYAFLRSVQQIEYNKEALEEIVKPLDIIANDENLPAHSAAIKIRFN
ncbi:MAG: histidinol dehydrogenase [Candidatus Ancillula sp.]|jgi:histidinol dehydrogenase|nr:histidinol dehydrogenase [Candidatus Ancillula sp.]